jgi:phosphate transport system permease protein
VSVPSAEIARARLRLARIDRFGDTALHALALLFALLTAAILAEVAHQLINTASGSISRFGLGFLSHSEWKGPPFDSYGALPAIYGTVVSSTIALLVATPLGIAIGLFLSVLAPVRLARAVGPLVEMLAAIPSVILGFWALLVLAPFVARHGESPLHTVFGFLPIFGTPQASGSSLFVGGLVLAIMVVPIIAALSRDLFLTVPRDLTDGAEALGATQWEVIRGVVLATTRSGVVSAVLLGLGRALGEAIAILQVSGGGSGALAHSNVFLPGDTLAARIANDVPNPLSKLETSSVFYLGVILLVLTVSVNLIAQWIGRRFAYQTAVAR